MDDESVIFPSVAETKVYKNVRGDLVVRQTGWPEEDMFVVIPKEFFDIFIESAKTLFPEGEL